MTVILRLLSESRNLRACARAQKNFWGLSVTAAAYDWRKCYREHHSARSAISVSSSGVS
jgi:hypothetical protein